MSTIETISQRLVLAFPDESKRSFKAATIIVNVGRLVPASYVYPLPPQSTSEERLHFICFILKKETGIHYTSNDVLTAHNILMGNQAIQDQLNFDCGIDKIQHYLNEYKNLQPQSAFARNFTPVLLLPHRTICSLCNAQLKIIFQSCAQVIYCTKIQSCLLYKADCHQCRRSYRISSIYLIDQKQTLVTAESQKSDYIHFSGLTVFSKEILICFSSQLIDNYVTFEGFAFATIKTFNRLHPGSGNVITADNLARNLQSVWLYYELTNFILMANYGYYYCDHHRNKRTEELSSETKMSDNELGKYLKYLKEFDREESQCNVGRNDMEERFAAKKRSMGFIASFLNCGIIIGFSDSINHEGPRKITDHLLTMLKLGAKLPSLVVYDAACQLYKFWRYRFGTEYMEETIYTRQLMNMTLVTDRFHNTVHTGSLCKTFFNPDSEKNKIKFIGINTSIAEQTFSYLTNFKTALRSFSYPTSALFTILLFHLKNCDKINQDPAQQDLIIGSNLETVIHDQQSYQTYCVFETLMMEQDINEADFQADDEYEDIIDPNDKNK
ncbi:unnamed protein product [Rotaria sordida]|uniref:Transposase n=1 Tax=Rotaria sordida TaxID=392033 RepID=A0A815PHT8_9BILA|nr:unnamed protein product [Rotaria sordida]CAF4064505.1 unnamed protein product [Rotaria sordida]